VRATGDIIIEVETRGGNAEERLRTLFTIVFASSGRLDQEIRIWAARDKFVKAALSKVDQTRLDYLKSLFEELGFPAIEATARARFSYHALIGQFTMGARTTMGENGPKSVLDHHGYSSDREIRWRLSGGFVIVL